MVLKMQSSSSGNNSSVDPEDFVDIWQRNIEQEFNRIRQLVQKYPYVAMVREMHTDNGYLLGRLSLVQY